ncbi:MAG: hypothetical protein NTV72_00160 [Candidatus Taylorbacteria bacterium]|nr:hypothetical protein [Candidatus Taylorbacteria bacterium]
MKNISYITNTATTILSIIAFQLLSALNIGNTATERGLYVFVCWFFLFVLCLFLNGYLPKNTNASVNNFAFSLMLDGILLLTGTLIISWLAVLISPKTPDGAEVSYFSLYYLIFVSIIKIIAQKKYIRNFAKITLSLLGVLIIANILPLPDSVTPYTFILTAFAGILLIGTFLYYFLNNALLGMGAKDVFAKKSF